MVWTKVMFVEVTQGAGCVALIISFTKWSIPNETKTQGVKPERSLLGHDWAVCTLSEYTGLLVLQSNVLWRWSAAAERTGSLWHWKRSHAILSPYGLYLYMCGCTYWVTSCVFWFVFFFLNRWLCTKWVLCKSISTTTLPCCHSLNCFATKWFAFDWSTWRDVSVDQFMWYLMLIRKIVVKILKNQKKIRRKVYMKSNLSIHLCLILSI